MIKQFIEDKKITEIQIGYPMYEVEPMIKVSDLETFMADKVVLPREIVPLILSSLESSINDNYCMAQKFDDNLYKNKENQFKVKFYLDRANEFGAVLSTIKSQEVE